MTLAAYIAGICTGIIFTVGGLMLAARWSENYAERLHPTFRDTTIAPREDRR